jgi:hypothetical protein
MSFFNDLGLGVNTGQPPYGQQPPMMGQQSSGFFGFGSTQQSPVAAQVTNIVPRLSSPNPQVQLAAASELKALAETEAEIARSQLGLRVKGTSMYPSASGMRSGLNAGEMMSVHPMKVGMSYGGKKTYRRRKQRGGSCGNGVASHAATFNGGRRRKRNGKKRSHRRR